MRSHERRRWASFTAVAATAATAALAAALLVPAGAAAQPEPATPIAAAALKKESFAVNGSFRNFVLAPSGQRRGVGDLGVARGPLVDASTGANAGSFTAVSRVLLRVKDAELRDTQIQMDLKGGALILQAVNEDPAGKPPETLHIMPVIGGTGKYVGARGTVSLIPIGSSGTFRFGVDIFTDARVTKSALPLEAWETVESPAPGTAPQGMGTVTQRRSVGARATVTAIATRVARAGSRITTSSDILIELEGGTLIGRSVVTAKGGTPKKQRFSVLGGTGEYAGVRGDGVLTNTRVTLRLNKRTGTRVVLSWFEETASTVTTDITGAVQDSASGTMTSRRNGAGTKRGDWFALSLTYAPMGEFIPVVTTLEQGFTEGTMLVTSITNGADAQPSYERAVVGGTADLGNYSGSALSTPLGDGSWQRRATIWG